MDIFWPLLVNCLPYVGLWVSLWGYFHHHTLSSFKYGALYNHTMIVVGQATLVFPAEEWIWSYFDQFLPFLIIFIAITSLWNTQWRNLQRPSLILSTFTVFYGDLTANYGWASSLSPSPPLNLTIFDHFWPFFGLYESVENQMTAYTTHFPYSYHVHCILRQIMGERLR